MPEKMAEEDTRKTWLLIKFHGHRELKTLWRYSEAASAYALLSFSVRADRYRIIRGA
jgi:hypothetical protein